MNLNDIYWHDNRKRVPKGAHAIFGASKYHWLNYDDDKMIETFNNSRATAIGTELHELACRLIRNKIVLPPIDKTLNMYVNDSIYFGMTPEVGLFYSKYFFGTADAMTVDSATDTLMIFDLKTGKTHASMDQLLIYVAFFLLEYELEPHDFSRIETRIYQNDEKIIEYPNYERINMVMDKIVRINEVISRMEEPRYVT